jgi:hypothetical protein
VSGLTGSLGRLAGSSFINERFGNYVRELLADNLQPGQDLDTIVEGDQVMQTFEYGFKRGMVFYKGVAEFTFGVSGLRENLEKGIQKNSFTVSK